MSADELRYTLPGRPVTWQRTNAVGGRYVTDKGQRQAKRAHALAAYAALGTRRASWALTGAFAVEVTGYWPDATVGDCDRLVSLPLDALEGITYASDRQVREVRGRVVADGSPPRVEVRLVRLAEDPVQSAAARRRAGRPIAGAGMGLGGEEASRMECDSGEGAAGHTEAARGRSGGEHG